MIRISEMRLMSLFFLLTQLSYAGEVIHPTTNPTGETQAWRKQREERLRAPDGWLSLVGLFWLKPGENPFGTDPQLPISLPPTTTLPNAGRFLLNGDQVSLEANPKTELTVNGHKSGGKVNIQTDESVSPDTIEIGRLKLLVIKRTKGYGIRVKDPNAPTRLKFRGLRWYPIQKRYRIEARFFPFSKAKVWSIENILGGLEKVKSPGQAEFQINGRPVSMVALEEEGELFFPFKDSTNGHETYSAGRFLYTSMPKDGKVILDFNRAFNPPCAFTKFATCPLPPRDNFLPIEIPAGERYNGHHS